jgi:hypothetical protein
LPKTQPREKSVSGLPVILKNGFMKKILIILSLVLTHTLFAQKVVLGLKAGANISNFNGGDFRDVEKNALVGYHAGGFLMIGISSFSVQPELLVSSAGAKFEDANQTNNIRLTYLALPVMAKYRTMMGLYFEAGPQFGFKLGENVGDLTISEFAKNLDLSACLGIGLQSRRGLGIGVRYVAGLSKVGEFDPTEGFDPDFQNSVVQVGLYLPLAN